MNPICTYDFTLKSSEIEQNNLILLLHNHCKKWAFQLEKGEKTGYIHYQGRFSLKQKQRKNEIYGKLNIKSIYLTPTSKNNTNNQFYVLKEETRIKGPFTDEMDLVPNYIPKQIRNIELYNWQKQIIELSKIWDTRHINIILDTSGNIGKSTLTTYMGVHKLACTIPFCNSYNDILRGVMDRPKRGCYILDMPRAINKEKLYQMFSAIETIKSGYAFDDRYNFREEYFDCPNIFIFTNKLPDIDLLTLDRWVIWEINNYNLEKYLGNQV